MSVSKFMQRLVNDADLMRAYQDDAEATMRANGVAGDEIDVRNDSFIVINDSFIVINDSFIVINDSFIVVSE